MKAAPFFRWRAELASCAAAYADGNPRSFDKLRMRLRQAQDEDFVRAGADSRPHPEPVEGRGRPPPPPLDRLIRTRVATRHGPLAVASEAAPGIRLVSTSKHSSPSP
ncbi:hypothetical protein EIB18_04705 [Caulobacter vibrioides]|nr:hypothetical protein EIB18_04705 [Caulobacter vibrioides]